MYSMRSRISVIVSQQSEQKLVQYVVEMINAHVHVCIWNEELHYLKPSTFSVSWSC